MRRHRFFFSSYAYFMSTIIPQPTHVKSLEGQFILLENATISAHANALEKAEQLARYLRPATGFALPVIEGTGGGIYLELDSKIEGSEAYELSVSNSSVKLKASGEAGLLYAIQSLRQLFPTQIFSESRVGTKWTIPCLEIQDSPRFVWRGAHLDVSRHFMPLVFVKKFIDLMALHKLNVFHWHLTDDQGWRLESKKYPRLTEVGAWRKRTLIGHAFEKPWHFDDMPHGGFYTQTEAREVVAYALERHITVMPEIEMPGHAQAALAAYPEFGNTGAKLEVWDAWGVNENVFNPLEPTILFLQEILEEVISIFPSTYIHVGGDECPKTQWEQSAAAQTRIRELGIPDEHALQSYFIGRMDKFLTVKGRRLVGWDEILEGGLTDNATVMSWRGEEGGISAAKAGHDVIMTPGSHTYFDHYQSENTELEPLAIGGFTSLEKVYGYEPIPEQLSELEARHVLGSQAQHWTEYMKDPGHVEYMSIPKIGALLPRWCGVNKTSRNYRRLSEATKTPSRATGFVEGQLPKVNLHARDSIFLCLFCSICHVPHHCARAFSEVSFDRVCRRQPNPWHSGNHLEPGSTKFLEAGEMLEQGFTAFGSNPWNVIKDAGHHRIGTQLAVVGDGVLVNFVAHSNQHAQGGVGLIQFDLAFLVNDGTAFQPPLSAVNAGQDHGFFAFGKPDHGNLESDFAQGIQRRIDLPVTAVNHQQIWNRQFVGQDHP